MVVLTSLAAFAFTCSAIPLGDPDSEMLLGTMQQELTRAQSSLAKSDPAPYFISYAVFDHENVAINASEGSLMSSVASKQRTADVTMRVGAPALDNTHGDGRESGIAASHFTDGNESRCGGARFVADDKQRIPSGGGGLYECENAEGCAVRGRR